MTAAMALLIVPNLAHLHPRQTTDVDLTFWMPQQLAVRGFETTTMAEVPPRWLSRLPAYNPRNVTVLSDDAEVQSPGRIPFRWASRVKANAASTLEMSIAWFPGWEARVDGQNVSAGPSTVTGLLTFEVPPGEHIVEVSYGRISLEKDRNQHGCADPCDWHRTPPIIQKNGREHLIATCRGLGAGLIQFVFTVPSFVPTPYIERVRSRDGLRYCGGQRSHRPLETELETVGPRIFGPVGMCPPIFRPEKRHDSIPSGAGSGLGTLGILTAPRSSCIRAACHHSFLVL
jgi:hypothetical protein